MAIESRNPLITKWTNNITNREKDTGLSAYAVGKVFAGSSLPDGNDGIDIDHYSTVGIFRITNSIKGTKPPISDITGFIQVMDINHDEESNILVKNTRRVRQIIYPDNSTESAPYTRVGDAASLTSTINWSEWSMMGGGGSLRRIVATANVPNARNNTMYEVFQDNITITLPEASTVPIGTKIGVEQYIGTGKVVCGTGDDRLEQITECDIEFYEPEDVLSPIMVTRWTRNPGTSNASYGRILTFSGSSGIDGTNTFTISGSGDIDGTYSPFNSNVSGQECVWKNGYVYCYYDTNAKIWKFVASYDGLVTITEILYQAEYSFKSADALCYIFECVIGEDGSREWILDVDNNFAKAVDILSERITHSERRIDKLDENEPYLHLIRTRTTRSIVNPSQNQLVCSAPAANATIEEKIARLKENNNNVHFYDFVVSVTSTRTINLPTTNIPLGAVVCIEVVGNCSATVVAGSYSDTYNGTAGEILVCEFEYTAIGANTYAWTILSLGGGTTSEPDEPIVPDNPVDPIVPVLTVVTPVNVTGLTQGVAMTPVQLSAYVENGLSSDIVFASTDIVDGLTLSSTGLISGTPTVSGDVSMNVVVSYPGAESKIIIVNFDINVALTDLFANVTDRVIALEEQSASLQTRQGQHEIDPAAHADLMTDVATVDEVDALRTAVDELVVMIEEKEQQKPKDVQTQLNEIVTTLRSGDVSTLTDKLGVPMSIPLTDSDGVTRNYRVMMTSIDTDDTPGYTHNARFEFLDIVDTRVYTTGVDTRYQTSDIRSYLTSEDADGFMVRLPTWLKNMIVPANIECITSYSSDTTETLSDKVFLPSAWELCGTVYTSYWIREGTKSTYYPKSYNMEDKRERYNLSGTAKSWWTRTPRYSGNIDFICVDSDGYVGKYNGHVIRSGVAPAFVIA